MNKIINIYSFIILFAILYYLIISIYNIAKILYLNTFFLYKDIKFIKLLIDTYDILIRNILIFDNPIYLID